MSRERRTDGTSERTAMDGVAQLGQRLPKLPGSYVLVWHAMATATVVIGSIGLLNVVSGWYLYTGSALGPGGLRARLRHHLLPSARPHWHVDYLRNAMQLAEIWVLPGVQRMEHSWAGHLASLPASRIPLPRFGASDCRCPSHLFHLPQLPPIDWLGFPDPGHLLRFTVDASGNVTQSALEP